MLGDNLVQMRDCHVLEWECCWKFSSSFICSIDLLKMEVIAGVMALALV